MVSKPVTELNAEETLAAFEAWHGEQRDRERRQLVAAAHFADLHHHEVVRDAGARVLPGMETATRLGGPGTPRVREFAAAELGARMGASPYAGRMLMADALDLRHRLPRLWARVRAGEVVAGYARLVAAATRELSKEAAGWVDSEVAAYADGRLGWSRFDTLVQGKVVAADPETAAERERAAAEEEFAKVGRSNTHGQKTLYVRSTTAAMVRIDATLTYLAAALADLGDLDTEDRRRAKAMLILANPVQAVQLLQTIATTKQQTQTTRDDSADDGDGDTSDASGQDTLPQELPEPEQPDTQAPSGAGDRPASADVAAGFTRPAQPYEIRPDARFGSGFDPARLLPRLTCYLHLYATTCCCGHPHHPNDTADIHASDIDGAGVGPVARWEGQGPVTTAYVRELLGPHARFTLKPVLDLAGVAPVDAYEIPDAHREAVHLRTPADIFPYAAATTSRDGRIAQLDHTRPYRPPADGGPPGQTGPHNLGPLTGFHHRVKTHGGWQLKQPFPGLYLWRDPHGRLYLVDHTGTRPLGHSPPTDRAGPDTSDITLHVSHFDDDPGLPTVEYVADRHAA